MAVTGFNGFILHSGSSETVLSCHGHGDPVTVTLAGWAGHPRHRGVGPAADPGPGRGARGGHSAWQGGAVTCRAVAATVTFSPGLPARGRDQASSFKLLIC
jgi:hypothetical protein